MKRYDAIDGHFAGDAKDYTGFVVKSEIALFGKPEWVTKLEEREKAQAEWFKHRADEDAKAEAAVHAIHEDAARERAERLPDLVVEHDVGQVNDRHVGGILVRDEVGVTSVYRRKGDILRIDDKTGKMYLNGVEVDADWKAVEP
jgi:hypothetical protein